MNPAASMPPTVRASTVPCGALAGLALLVGAHPDPEKARERVALLREYWPKTGATGPPRSTLRSRATAAR